MIFGHRMDVCDMLFSHQVPGTLEVVARHQAGDRAQQGEGSVHTPRACIGSQGQADQTRKWISECILSSVLIKCLVECGVIFWVDTLYFRNFLYFMLFNPTLNVKQKKLFLKPSPRPDSLLFDFAFPWYHLPQCFGQSLKFKSEICFES